jgi:hypothetical protein
MAPVVLGDDAVAAFDALADQGEHAVTHRFAPLDLDSDGVPDAPDGLPVLARALVPAIGGPEVWIDAGCREFDLGVHQGEERRQIVLVHRPIEPSDHCGV